MTRPSATGPGAFAVRLRRLREAAALTQEELAARAGLTVKAVGALERGERRRPYPHTVRALADALQLDEPARARSSRRPGRVRRGCAPAEPAARAAVTAPADQLVGREVELHDVVPPAAGARAPAC